MNKILLATGETMLYNDWVYAAVGGISDLSREEMITMSASSKKKLRNELNAAAMTEKQLQEQKEAKKLRFYTGLFAAAIAVMILVVVISRVFSSGIIPRNTTALTVGGTKISSAELNHYYIDGVNQFLGQYGDYVSLVGLDTSKALDEQFYNETEKQTWADYFLDSATSSAQSMYAIYNEANAKGFKMSDEETKTMNESIEATLANFELYAGLYGFGSTDAYIAAYYGEGCNADTFRDYAEVQMIASAYYSKVYGELTYEDADIRAAEAENFNAYSSFTYNYHYLAASKFYEGGTEDENGVKTYSDAEKEAGRAAAEAAANALLTATNIEELDAAIAALPMNAELETAPKSTRQADYLYANVPAAIREWVAGDRKAGDIAILPSESTTHNHAEGEECTGDDGTTVVNGYYVVLFESKDDNLTKLVNVRHALAKFKGGKTDEKTGTVIYTDEEKATAKAEAQAILDAYLAGERTEEAFAALANEKSDDGDGTTGGLYEKVYPNQMVANFNSWIFDKVRTPGDVDLVETEYGWHVMYYVGQSDMTYRDLMIENDLRNADLSAWETELLEANKLVVENTKYIETGLTLSSGK